MSERKQILLRLDPSVHDAIVRWAADELRSTTAQIEFLLRQSLNNAGRMPKDVGGLPRRGRPRKQAETAEDAGTEGDGSGGGGDSAGEDGRDDEP
ncbi:MAG TPA: hypothetical protein VFU65_13780 [Actinocrinis sp.]|nr:hypothetical protein [Actinocrinis sp.]